MKADVLSKYEAMGKLRLTEDERMFALEAMRVLEESFTPLFEIDATGVEPLVSVLDIENVFREDISSKAISREELLLNAPGKYDGYFQVPKVR